MKAAADSKRVELCCEVILMLAILTGGGVTAMTVYSVTNPPRPGGFVMDYVPEIGVMATVLNVGLPLAVVALGIWLVLQARGGRVQWITAAFAVAGFLGVFGCAVALWFGLAAMHPGTDLWSTRIWWR